MFLRKFASDVRTALIYNPRLVIKVTSACAFSSAAFGATLGAGFNYMDAACAAGQYILDNAIKYKCTADGNPCPQMGEAADGKPLTLDCHGNQTAETLLEHNANVCYDAYPNNYFRLAISTTVGFIAGGLFGFVAGVKCAASRARASGLPTTDRTPLIRNSVFIAPPTITTTAAPTPTSTTTSTAPVNYQPEGVSSTRYGRGMRMSDMA